MPANTKVALTTSPPMAAEEVATTTHGVAFQEVVEAEARGQWNKTSIRFESLTHSWSPKRDRRNIGAT